MKLKNFLLCGIIGWCMEVLFTSFGSLLHGDFKLMARTSLWMFPIYGLAFLIVPVYERLRSWPPLARGIFYGSGIMIVEFLSGSILSHFGFCPWDYSGSLYSIAGIVRLDYFPFWVVAGLVFERILCGQGILRSTARQNDKTDADSHLPPS